MQLISSAAESEKKLHQFPVLLLVINIKCSNCLESNGSHSGFPQVWFQQQQSCAPDILTQSSSAKARILVASFLIAWSVIQITSQFKHTTRQTLARVLVVSDQE